MTINIPAFVASQLPVVPLKGNWRRQPKNSDQSPQDDMFVSQELDWSFPLGNTPAVTAVAFNMQSTSPVIMSQIAALVVDNSRCGTDISFWFADTGFELTVDARAQGIFPVLTNALSFLVIGKNPTATDITLFQVCNTVPPPIAQLAGTAQQVVGAANIAILAGTVNTQLVPAGQNGTVVGFQITYSFINDATQSGVTFVLIDGNNNIIWTGNAQSNANSAGVVTFVSPSPLNVRFFNGLIFRTVNSATNHLIGSGVYPNVYVTQP